MSEPIHYPLCGFTWGVEPAFHLCRRPKGHGGSHRCECGRDPAHPRFQCRDHDPALLKVIQSGSDMDEADREEAS